MKKKIIILGSTGSIGKTTLNIIKKNKNNFIVDLLTTNKNINVIENQCKEFNVKNIIISSKLHFEKFKKKNKNKKLNIFNDFNIVNKILKKKVDYCMSAITGLAGLEPTLKCIKHSKKIAIANKESIICAWNLIKNELKKNNTEFIPIDSEHFSINELIKFQKNKQIKKIIITASGGPFLNKKNKKMIKIHDALKHPTWKMGKKISIDSSTLMNKVFEVIEAKKIFNLQINKIAVLINPNSYLHAIVIFKNGTIKMLVHETSMDIPIYNSIYNVNYNNAYNTKFLDLNKINNLNLSKPNTKYFKTLKLLKLIPDKNSLFETILISINDKLVEMFLNEQITYKKLLIYLNKIIKFKIFKKYSRLKPKSINDIVKANALAKTFVNEYVRKKN